MAREAGKLSLCASVRAVPWVDEAEQQLGRLAFMNASYLQTFAFWEQGCRRRSARTPKLRLKFEVTRQASNPSLFASVRAVPWADEAEQQLCRLAFMDASYLQTFAFWEQDCRRLPVLTPKDTLEF